MKNHAFTFAVLLATTLLASGLTAQKWRTEQVPEAGIQFDVPDRLERLPMKIGASAIHRRARLRPNDINDYVRSMYEWTCDVYEFRESKGKDGEVELPEGIPEEMKEELKRLLQFGQAEYYGSFREWLEGQKNIDVLQEAKKKRGKGRRLPYQHWVYTQVTPGFGPVSTNYCEAAVYDLGDREIALVIEMPLEKAKPPKPKSKWNNIIKKVMRSGEACEVDDTAATFDKKRDKFADTDAKKAALAKAKANIANLQGWDYFTTPNYIVLYSWDFERASEESKAKKEAEFYSSRLERMRELYLESYPLDQTGTKAILPDPTTVPGMSGPITGAPAEASEGGAGAESEPAKEKGKDGVVPYSVFRLCATYDQFRKYGQSPPGVVGWYSPASKELVVFLGGDKMMGLGATETVTYHEGWHQFADLYFHHPDAPKHATLHRWFDEGHGDYFGSFRWTGSKWKYGGSKMRHGDCKQMVQQEDYVPFKDIVGWPRNIFYGAKAPYYYAQAFSMVDFLRRGKNERDYKESWSDILDMYRRVVLLTGDAKQAVEIAFRDFKTDEDWKELETAWARWVSGSKFLSGS